MIIKVNAEIELREISQEDAQDIFNVINSQRKYLGKWLPFVELTQKLVDTQNFVKSIINVPQEKFEYVFTIRKQNEFIGLIGFKDTDRLNKKTEIGYWLSQDFQKQGIMGKAVQKLCDFAFSKLNINRIQIKCATENIPSKKIPIKLGFKFEGIERQGELLSGNIYTDLEIYSKLKNEK